MTKAQATALLAALEARSIPCDVLLRFDAAGAEQWSVQLDTVRVYTGAELAALTSYCANNGLTVTVLFQQLGVT